MKRIVLALSLVLILALTSMAGPRIGGNKGSASPPMALTVHNDQYINANNLLMFVTNHGNFARDLSGIFGKDYGTFYPYTSIDDIINGVNDNSINYASGLWVGAIDSAADEIRVTVAEYSDEYVPGPMDEYVSDNGTDTVWTFMTDIPEFKVYKLYADSLADSLYSIDDDAWVFIEDYTNWPIDQGAPWKLDSLNDTIPDMIGTQMLWSVYNDADPAQHDNDAGLTAPLGLEVQQTTFAFDRTDPLGNVIFLRFQVYNRGGRVLNQCYFSLWADIDLGNHTDDLVGCDSTLDLGYAYNGNNDDQQYGDNPPSIGYDFFQGPMVPGLATDTARMWGTIFPGMKNLGMASFNKYINGTDPDDFNQTYNYMQGLNRDGTVYTYNGIPTTYFVAGDPVGGSGDLDYAPEDRRIMLSTGPIDFRPGDSTEFLAAIVVGQAVDRKSSISLMKYYDRFAQATYEADFEVLDLPAKPVVTVALDDNRVSLHWTDTSEVSPGSYPFEGYIVSQGASVNGPWTKIAAFDLVNSVEDILGEVFDPITGAEEMKLLWNGDNAGVERDIVIEEDFIYGGPLFNSTEYIFKVEAYTYNENGTPTSLSDFVVKRATPQSAVAGTDYEYDFGDMIDVAHVGYSDGNVTGYVLNNELFDGSAFRIDFTDTLGFRIDTIYDPAFPDDTDAATFISYDVVWHLVNTTTGDTIVGWEWNQSSDTTHEVIDGLQMVVSAPPVELKTLEYEGGDIPITGVDWAGSEFGGGVGLLGEFWGSSLSPADLKIIEFRWVDDGTGQNAYCYRRDNGYAYEAYEAQNFTLWDITTGTDRQINFGFVEYYLLSSDDGQNADSVWNPGEQRNIDSSWNSTGGREYFFVYNSDYTVTPDGSGTYMDVYGFEDADVLYAGWVTRGDLEDTLAPGKPAVGDVWRFTPNIVNSSADVFSFTLTAPMVATPAEELLDKINVAPNPFYLFGPYDPTPGNYQLKFRNLPEVCTIRIFNLGGDLVRTIEKTDPSSSETTWDILTENSLPVASGIYIYVVDAPGYGTKIGKMAIFTEEEVLETY